MSDSSDSVSAKARSADAPDVAQESAVSKDASASSIKDVNIESLTRSVLSGRTNGRESNSKSMLANMIPSFPVPSRRLLRWLLPLMLVLVTVEWFWIASRRPNPLIVDRGDAFRLDFQVDMNRATWIEWSQLEGIGPELAHRIVAHRRVHGPFASVDDLQMVPGIGLSKLDAIRHQLTIRHEYTEPQFTRPDQLDTDNTSAETGQSSAIR